MTKVVLENAKHIFELLYGPLYAFLEPSSESTEGLERLRLTFDEILPPFITKAGGDSLHILNSKCIASSVILMSCRLGGIV